MRRRRIDGRWSLPALVAATSLLAQGQPDQPGLETATDGASIESLRGARDSLIEVADFNAALEPAERVVAELDARGGGPGLGQDLLSLARVEAGLGDLDAAERDYLRADEILREEDAPVALRIAAKQAVGRVYISAQRFPEAIAALEEARTLSRESAGLFNVEQSGLMDDLTLAHIGVGNTVAARDLQVQRLENAERRFGPDDPRMIPFLSHLGDYYDRSRLRVSAREQYTRALEIGERELGADARPNLEMLRRLIAIDLALGESGEARERLASILASSDDIAPAERGQSLAVLGDWALVNETLEAALDYYSEAYAVLAVDGPGNAAAYFAEPRMIDFVPPLTPVDRATRSDRWAWGDLVLEFEVGADGRAYDVKTRRAEPRQPRITSAYTRRISETHFRPRLRDGEAVTTTDVRYNQSFRYYVRD